jgi:hypothetical protein
VGCKAKKNWKTRKLENVYYPLNIAPMAAMIAITGYYKYLKICDLILSAKILARMGGVIPLGFKKNSNSCELVVVEIRVLGLRSQTCICVMKTLSIQQFTFLGPMRHEGLPMPVYSALVLGKEFQ